MGYAAEMIRAGRRGREEILQRRVESGRPSSAIVSSISNTAPALSAESKVRQLCRLNARSDGKVPTPAAALAPAE
jgi:hypothetical protein